MAGRVGLTLVLIGAAAPACAQTIGRGIESDVPWIRLIGALLLCLLLAAAAVVALRAKMQGQGPLAGKRIDLRRIVDQLRSPWIKTPHSSRLAVLETTWLGNNVSVSILRCDGRDYLVGTTPQGRVFIRPLIEPSDPDPT